MLAVLTLQLVGACESMNRESNARAASTEHSSQADQHRMSATTVVRFYATAFCSVCAGLDLMAFFAGRKREKQVPCRAGSVLDLTLILP